MLDATYLVSNASITISNSDDGYCPARHNELCARQRKRTGIDAEWQFGHKWWKRFNAGVNTNTSDQFFNAARQ
jgi:hypothetical protein